MRAVMALSPRELDSKPLGSSVLPYLTGASTSPPPTLWTATRSIMTRSARRRGGFKKLTRRPDICLREPSYTPRDVNRVRIRPKFS